MRRQLNGCINPVLNTIHSSGIVTNSVHTIMLASDSVYLRIGLITLNRPDLGKVRVRVRYLYCSDNSIVSLWDVLSTAHAYKTYAKCYTKPHFLLILLLGQRFLSSRIFRLIIHLG